MSVNMNLQDEQFISDVIGELSKRDYFEASGRMTLIENGVWDGELVPSNQLMLIDCDSPGKLNRMDYVRKG